MASQTALLLMLLASWVAAGAYSRPEVNKLCLKKDNNRLPVHIKPTNYELKLKPDLKKFTFWGRVAITVKLVDDKLSEGYRANEIALHAHSSLEILNSHYQRQDGRQVQVVGICRDPQSDMLVLTLESKLESAVEGLLEFEFAGSIGDDPHGFYRSPYTRASEMSASKLASNKDFMVATFFQPNYARRALPCFDEPAFKATFEVSLAQQDSSLTVLSNTDVERTEVLEVPTGASVEKVTFARFARTPLMSTYLLAFAVGKFEFAECHSPGNSIRVRLYTAPGKKARAQFATETACEAIARLEQYFDIPFPLHKIDMLAVPEFAMGAMENWGLVTYRENMILMDELHSGDEQKTNVANHVMHEFSHQWFGNLVTMKWWSELWLNEGFATWLAFEQTAQQLPDELDQRMEYLKLRMVPALVADAAESSHPVSMEESEVNGDQVGDMFDAISYNKGSAVVRWLHDQYVQPDQFKAAITSYLRKHSWSNADKHDLVRAIEDEGRVPVDSFLNEWLHQSGYPLIEVAMDASRGLLNFKQSRFVAGRGKDKKARDKTRWTVPIHILIGHSQTGRVELFSVLLKSSQDQFELPKWFKAGTGGFWFKVNPGMVGFYRVKYDSRSLQALSWPLFRNQLDTVDRFHLLNDLVALCDAGQAPWSDLVELLKSLTQQPELDGFVLGQMAEAVDKLRAQFPHVLPNAFIYGLFKPVVDEFKFPSFAKDTPNMRLARTTAMMQLVDNDHMGAVRAALKAFDMYEDSRLASVEPNLRLAMYSAVAKYGDQGQYSAFVQMVATEKSLEERSRMASGWARASSSSRLQSFFRWLGQPDTALEYKSDFIEQIAASEKGLEWLTSMVESNGAQLLRQAPSLGWIYSLLVKSRSRALLTAAKYLPVKQKKSDNWHLYYEAAESEIQRFEAMRSTDQHAVKQRLLRY